MGQVRKNFTTPVVCSYDGDTSEEWYIFFQYFHAGKWHKFKKREGINRIKDARERMAEAKALREARELWLKMGWNPVTDPEFEARKTIGKAIDFADVKNWPIEKALQFALSKKQLATKSRFDYSTTVRYVAAGAKSLFYDQVPISGIKRVHVKAIMDELRKLKGLSAKSYNRHLDYFKSLLSELVEWEAIEFNPAYRIAYLETEDTQKYVPPTVEEKNLIREYLYLTDYHFFVYVISIYHTGIRPKEILGLQIKDYDENRSVFHLKPVYEKTKTKKERTVTINQHLLRYIKQLGLNGCPPDYYIFSTDFKPGPARIDRKLATSRWNELVRGQLGIDKYMYSLKHLGADDLITRGKEKGVQNIEDVVRDHLGHSSKFMTRRYTQKGLELSRKVVADLSNDF